MDTQGAPVGQSGQPGHEAALQLGLMPPPPPLQGNETLADYYYFDFNRQMSELNSSCPVNQEPTSLYIGQEQSRTYQDSLHSLHSIGNFNYNDYLFARPEPSSSHMISDNQTLGYANCGQDGLNVVASTMEPVFASTTSTSQADYLCQQQRPPAAAISVPADNYDACSQDGSETNKKQNHSEIEKRRRDKMNHYITELSKIVPVCGGMSRKLDKLTVLRMAVQHMKTIRGNMSTLENSGLLKPTFLSDNSLHQLILQIAEGFLFVVSCDRGKLLFVSESVSQILNYCQSDLLGQNWFDILHPKDIAKVKEQLSSCDLSPKDRLIDAKTMLPIKTDVPSAPAPPSRMCPGDRRSFFCRMKCKSVPTVKEEADTTTGMSQKKRKNCSQKKYCVIHCVGYLKSWASSTSSKSTAGDEAETETENPNLSCLVAVGRAVAEFKPPTWNDQGNIALRSRATLILGYLPQELLDTSCYEYCHPGDIKSLAESHRNALISMAQITSKRYRFKTKSGTYICLETRWKTFKNPWTKEFEYIVARNTCVPMPEVDTVCSSNVPLTDTEMASIASSSSSKSSLPTGPSALDNMLSNLNKKPSGYASSNGSSSSESRVKKMLSSSRINLWKIGKQIADEALEIQRKYDDSSSQSNFSSSSSSPSTQDQNGLDSANTSASRFASRSGGFSPSSGGLNGHSLAPPGPPLVAPEAMNSFSTIAATSHDSLDPYLNIGITGDPMLSTGGPGLPVAGPSCQPETVNLKNAAIVPDVRIGPNPGPDMANAYLQNNANEENDEAAMALIMSILEADAGLGGPVDFSGLPWPLF
ncbi:Aryl hydrocarbon receptor nuclear translocator-like protein 1 [Halotydeus destructor]|nr:Aryl hydrocarbon receptor nuclear translocator-like protein 1 [Halotydeus destructor]